ncbi:MULTISPECIES: HD domain-containing protein [unclassified Xanthobacter]|uniref:HD domain-containing protein n=1 Tax=unclassified Xanthobacter TaxID=2623496 RepID=UPI001F427D64|nr:MULTISPECIES: HD domain-containing protein [unclassified Xanthobacter]
MDLPLRAPFQAWDPLADHCADVAAVALLMLRLIQRRLAALAGVADVLPVRTARLCALAFLHDFGKANHRLQRGDGAM